MRQPWTLRLVFTVLALGLAAGSAGAARHLDRSSAQAAKYLPVNRAGPRSGEWQFFQPRGKTGCARKRAFGFWAHLVSRQRLLIYFEGGGGCFSYQTCKPGSLWFDDVVNGMDDPQRHPVGIFDLGNGRNPFRGWSIVFIPSCTGDVFLGSTDHTYREGAKRVTIRHRGWFNAEAAIQWAFENVPEPDRVFVAGSSAGSVGSAFHAPEIIERYRGAKIAQLGDSLAFASREPMRLTEWHGLDHLPAWMSQAPDVQPGRFRMVNFLARLIAHYPNVAFTRFNFRADRVQAAFYGGPARVAAFTKALVQDERTLRKRSPRYRSLLACGSGHMVLPARSFYGLTVVGLRLRDWVARLAEGEPVSSATCSGH